MLKESEKISMFEKRYLGVCDVIIKLNSKKDEILKTKEQAILNPEIGDRWQFLNGLTYQLTSLQEREKGLVYDKDVSCWYCRGGLQLHEIYFAYAGEDFNAKVHNAKYLGNFALKKVDSPKTQVEALGKPELGDRWKIAGVEFQIGRMETYDGGKTTRVYASSKTKDDQFLGIVGEDFNSKMCWHQYVGNFALTK